MLENLGHGWAKGHAAVLPGKATAMIAPPHGRCRASIGLEVAEGALAQGVGVKAECASHVRRVDDAHRLGPGRFRREEFRQAIRRPLDEVRVDAVSFLSGNQRQP